MAKFPLGWTILVFLPKLGTIRRRPDHPDHVVGGRREALGDVRPGPGLLPRAYRRVLGVKPKLRDQGLAHDAADLGERVRYEVGVVSTSRITARRFRVGPAHWRVWTLLPRRQRLVVLVSTPGRIVRSLRTSGGICVNTPT